MTDYERGYQQALADLNTPMKVIQEPWLPSKCPRCDKRYGEYEPCDDGYYERAVHLIRCPDCGQKLDWYSYHYDDEEDE